MSAPIVIAWRLKLESRSNKSGHTLWANKPTRKQRRDATLRCAAAGIDRWTVPDPSVLVRKPRKTPYKRPPPPITKRGVRLVRPISVLMVRVSPGTLDDDNIRGAFKAIRDGIADAVGSDDRNPLIVWEYGQRKGKPAVRVGGRVVALAEYGVEITITERAP